MVEGSRRFKKLKGQYFDRHVRTAYVAGSIGIAPELVGPLMSYGMNQEATTRFFFGPYEVLEVLDILVRMVFSLSTLACKRKKVQPRNCFAGCVAMHLLPTLYPAARYRAR
jgi:hypothetical protein